MKQAIKRKLIQIAAFGLTNSHVQNFVTGKIYQGKWKQFCAPGLHCYSCPAATVSCPIGAMQAVSGSMKFDFSFYVVGLVLAFGVVLGRLICGFLCPFGLIQELLHKIPLPKLHLPKWAVYVKYAVLVIFVLLMPVLIVNIVGMGDPAFCKWICPSGTLTGAVPLLLADPALQTAVGGLFWLKAGILAAVLVGSMLVYRFFCKLLCPLGAVYGLLNKVSLYRLRVDEDKCIHCGKCAKVCLMDVNPVKSPDSIECIRCGICAENCPVGAIRLGFGFGKGKSAPEKAKCAGSCLGCSKKGCGAKEN